MLGRSLALYLQIVTGVGGVGVAGKRYYSCVWLRAVWRNGAHCTSGQSSMAGAALAHTSMPQKARGSSAMGPNEWQQLPSVVLEAPRAAFWKGKAKREYCNHGALLLTCAGSGEQQVGALWLLHSHSQSAAEAASQPPKGCSQNASQAARVGGCDVQLASQHACRMKGTAQSIRATEWLRLHAVQGRAVQGRGQRAHRGGIVLCTLGSAAVPLQLRADSAQLAACSAHPGRSRW